MIWLDMLAVFLNANLMGEIKEFRSEMVLYHYTRSILPSVTDCRLSLSTIIRLPTTMCL